MLTRIHKAVASTTFLLAIVMAFSVSAWAQDRADFSLRAIDGPTVTSESLRGQVVVLAFGASWLPLTRNQMEGVKKVADQYAGRGVVAYWVSTDSESLKSKNFVADEELRGLARKYNVKVLRDPDGAISKKLGVDQLPSVVIIDKQGNVSGTAGGLDPNADLAKQLATRLDKLL
jgi:cytochrome c biogenesis protein CcmG/thiol:disulfide interchange protein DsbE